MRSPSSASRPDAASVGQSRRWRDDHDVTVGQPRQNLCSADVDQPQAGHFLLDDEHGCDLAASHERTGRDREDAPAPVLNRARPNIPERSPVSAGSRDLDEERAGAGVHGAAHLGHRAFDHPWFTIRRSVERDRHNDAAGHLPDP